MYDIIGDIHGHAKTLEKLLYKLGYEEKNGFYVHKSRMAVFVGDYIDRGPQIRETLQLIKAMVDNKSAHAIMGNHEYNAICYHTKNELTGEWLRKHSEKNNNQHKVTLEAFKNHKSEWEEYINWFKGLPLFIEFDNIRVVHATWDYKHIKFLKNNTVDARMNFDFLIKSSIKGTDEFEAVEVCLKGHEIKLPENCKFSDKEGVVRDKIRVKWWVQLNNANYRSLSISADNNLPVSIVCNGELNKISPYNKNEMPVFFGHYWMTGKPKIIEKNVCCVDYSVAKNGKLVAYRYNGNNLLKNENFVFHETS